MSRLLASVVALGLLFATSAAQAEPAPGPSQTAWLRKTPPKPAAKVESKPALSPFRVGTMLFLVAGLGGFAFYARRRKGATKAATDGERLSVLASTRLGPKAHAVVTRVAGRRLLLGVTDQSVTVLAWLDSERTPAESPSVELDEPAELSGILTAHEFEPIETQAQSPSGFLRLLRSAVGSGAVSPAEELASSTRDEVQVSRRAVTEARDAIEGQAAGILRRKRAPQ